MICVTCTSEPEPTLPSPCSALASPGDTVLLADGPPPPGETWGGTSTAQGHLQAMLTHDPNSWTISRAKQDGRNNFSILNAWE